MPITDVAIIGAGPVGLFAAVLLEREGVSVKLYEKWATLYPLPRACGVDHEIIRQLQGAGLAEALEPYLDPVIGPEKTYEFLDKSGERLLKIEWNRPGASGWAQMNMFYQPDLETALLRRIEQSARVQIDRGWTLIALDQRSGHVDLTFAATEHASRQLHDRARFVIGADGARSTVRELAGIGQTDLGFAYDWLVVDVVPHEQRVWKPYVVQHCDPARPTTLVGSGPRRRRWEFMRLPGETAEELNTAAMAWKLLARWDIAPHNATLERHAVYTFRGSWADRWRDGRAFLIGDAAHLMPPFLGQGLCAGMRDAMALSWRLTAVLRGAAPDVLLDSYGPERSGHVQEIIRQAVELGRLICMLDPVEAATRDERMKAALANPALAVKPPPEPRLGESDAYLPNDVHAGFLSVQARVQHDGREGLFDDVIGSGWQLLLRPADDAFHGLDREMQEAVLALDAVVATFGAQGDTVDLDGTYKTWFERLEAEAVLVRPDFYVFGTAPLARLGPLLASAVHMLGRRAAPHPEIACACNESRSRQD